MQISEDTRRSILVLIEADWGNPGGLVAFPARQRDRCFRSSGSCAHYAAGARAQRHVSDHRLRRVAGLRRTSRPAARSDERDRAGRAIGACGLRGILGNSVENESFLWTGGRLQLWPIARCRAAPYDANTPMATSTGELREARGAEARATSGASRAAQTKKRQYEVRRRNGHRKVARTLADRILVLTKAVQGNLDGFVAYSRTFVV